MVQLDICYRDGVVVDADFGEALSLFKQATELGDGNGLIYLEMCYRTGSGVDENHNEAARLFGIAANGADCGRHFRLAHSYFSKRERVVDNETFRMCKAMAHAGSSYGQLKMGIAYLNADADWDSETEDPIDAARYFRMAAERVSNESRMQLGKMYMKGSGVKHDVDEAVELFEEAAFERNSGAYLQLGIFYLDEISLQKDECQAVELFRISKLVGDEKAFVALGLCYMNGPGVV